MAEYTANYDLEKQQANEYIRIEGLNENFDKIDTEINKLQKETTYAETTLSQDKTIFSSGTGKDSVGIEQNYSDIVEGQSTVKLEGFTAQNLVKNGDFSDGIIGWGADNSSISATSNVLSIVADGTTASGRARHTTMTPYTTDRKVFIRAKVRVTNSNCSSVDLLGRTSSLVTTSIVGVQLSPLTNVYYSLSGVLNCSNTDGTVVVEVVQRYTDSDTANGKVMEVKDVFAIDLTSTFGKGNEPTKEQCDIMFDHYINGLQGVGNHKIVSRGRNLFDKDSAVLEGVIMPDSGIFHCNFACCHSDFIMVKPSTSYTQIKTDLYYMAFYDINKNYIGTKNAATFTTPFNCAYIRVSALISNIDKVMVIEGDAVGEYEPYKSSELLLSLPNGMQLNRLPNGVKDTIEEINGVRALVKRTKEYILQAGNIIGISSAETSNIDYLIISYVNINDVLKPESSDMFGTSMLTDRTVPRNNIAIDVDEGTWRHWQSSIEWFLSIPKGTYATLSQAQAALAGTKIIYELAAPVIYTDGQAGFHCDGNLEAFPHGTIYFEPITQKENVNPKQIDITYNLTDKAIQMANSNKITAINKKISGRLKNASGCEESGRYANAEGISSKAVGDRSHAEGYCTQSLGYQSHAEGYNTKSIGNSAHAEGSMTTASGHYSHSEGIETIADGNFSHSEGCHTKAQGEAQHVSGRYNEPNATDLFQVGMGTSDANRKNAMRVTAEGDIISGEGASLNELNKNMGFIRYMDLISTDEEYNKPYEYIQSIWETLPLNMTIIANIVDGSKYVAIIQKYGYHGYGSMIIMGYGLKSPIYGRITNGIWQDAVNL
ncbi:MAG: hypothetical protein E7255_05490 [Lachnospiraceae bacterium]|nr:hypothetical protein [Lachnospiraceae bacterium]